MRLYEKTFNFVNCTKKWFNNLHLKIIEKNPLYKKKVNELKWTQERLSSTYEKYIGAEETRDYLDQKSSYLLEELVAQKELLEAAREKIRIKEQEIENLEKEKNEAYGYFLESQRIIGELEKKITKLNEELTVTNFNLNKAKKELSLYETQLNAAKHWKYEKAQYRSAFLNAEGKAAESTYGKFVILLDHHQRISKISSYAAKKLGYSPNDKELKMKKVYELITCQDKKNPTQLEFFLNHEMINEKKDKVFLKNVSIKRPNKNDKVMDLVVEKIKLGEELYVGMIIRLETKEEKNARLKKEAEELKAKEEENRRAIETEKEKSLKNIAISMQTLKNIFSRKK